MIEQILRLIDRNEAMSFFLGAGFSLGKWVNNTRDGLGTGEELATHLIQQNSLLNSLPNKNLMNVCDEYSFLNDSELRDELQKYLGKGKIQNTHRLLVDVIEGLNEPKDLILTVNVDDLLEQAYREKHGTLLSTAKRAEDLYIGGSKVYLKLHGCVTDIKQAVFTTKDYLNVDHDNKLFDKIQSLFTERSIVFVGFGMTDVDILRKLYRVKPQSGFTKPNYWIVPKGKEWSNSRANYYLKEFNINHIDMTAEEFFQQINDHLKKKKTVKF